MITFAGIFGDGMVLQRGAATLWGGADPGESFVLTLGGQRLDVETDSRGAWRASFTEAPAGGPYPLLVDGHFHCQVWVGDVWLCAGQSNMERTLQAGAEWPTDPLVLGGDPGLRQLCLPLTLDFTAPRADHPEARWIGADADVVLFSAVGFSFAKELRSRTGVPQGLVLAAVGGSSAQSWLSLAALSSFPLHRDRALWLADSGRLAALQQAEASRRETWYRELEAVDPPDPARQRGPWRTVELPGTWASWGEGAPGSGWLRKRFTLDAGPGAARLLLGMITESDEAWLNGVWVGQTGYQYPRRRYPVPEGLLRPGVNELLVRVVVPRGGGALLPGKPLALRADGLDLDLAGHWEFCRGASMSSLPADTFLPMEPLGVHQGMLAPLSGLPLRAVLWYQGESNAGDPSDYGPLLKMVVDEFRRLWNWELPFLTVQLPLYGPSAPGAGADGWAEVQHQQRRLLELPNTGLAIAIDQGDPYDLHPGEKAEVGRRLALVARRVVYGEALETWTGPLLAASTVEAGRLRLRFEQTGTGLRTRDGLAPDSFFVAGSDGVFYRARVELSGCEALVDCPLVPRPLFVRYAWASNPAGANLVNSEGLPASPFRTDAGDRRAP